MFTPLEDERFQIGVIFLASISIVSFLLHLASQTMPEAVPLAETASPELLRKAEPIVENPDHGSEEAVSRDVAPPSVETIEEAVLRTRESSPLPSLRGAEGEHAIQGHYHGAGVFPVAHNDPRKARYHGRGVGRSEEVVPKKARREKRGAFNEPWQSSLPNKKGGPEE